MRPPWSVPEDAFVERCTRCDRCIDACAQGVLARGSGGFPEARFTGGACTFCGDCARACPENAFERAEPSARAAWRLRAQVLDACLAARGVVCRACGDVCEPRAIRFRLLPGGRALPLIERAGCTGCGGCIGVCPVGAIRLEPIDEEERDP